LEYSGQKEAPLEFRTGQENAGLDTQDWGAGL